MFLTVLAATIPNIRLHEPLATAQAAILAGIVFVSMLLILTPYVLNHLAEISAAKINATKDKNRGEEQMRTVFADLRTLRNSLIEQMESTQTARNLTNDLAQDLMTEKMRSKKLADSVSEGAQKTKAIAESLENFKAILDEFKSQLDDVSDDSMLEPRVTEVETQSKKLVEEFADIKKQISELIEEIQTAISPDEEGEELEDVREDEDEKHIARELADDSESLGAETSEDFGDDLDEENQQDSDDDSDFSEVEEKADAEAQSATQDEDSDQSASEGSFLDAKNHAKHISDTEVEEPIKAQKTNWSGMIDKALSNSQAFNTKSVVSRFIEKNKAGDAPDLSEQTDAPISQKLNEPDVSESESASEVEKSAEFKELEKEPAISKKAAQGSLFDESEIPESKKVKAPTSDDTALIANAFLGIGNTPFVRGNSAGLNPEKGTAMQMLEIGKWQWICEALPTDPIKITVWLNDEKPSPLGEIVLNPGETLDIDLTF